jgi:hypothetical protein
MKIRDLLWIWGMKVNALQETADYETFPFGRSSITTEQVIRRTGITNVYIAGGLDLTKETLDSMPSAKRLVCKTSVHKAENSRLVMDLDDAINKLRDVKKLCLSDHRIEAFAVDDFSTGSMLAGVTEDDLAKFCFKNALEFPFLPLHSTIYPMSLDDKKLPGMLKYFDEFLLPIWFTDDAGHSYEYIDKLDEISGKKPILYCLYVYDFGTNKFITRAEMQKQLDIAEKLLHEGRITGCMLLGTCLFDLGWEPVKCMYEWIDRAGNDKVDL